MFSIKVLCLYGYIMGVTLFCPHHGNALSTRATDAADPYYRCTWRGIVSCVYFVYIVPVTSRWAVFTLSRWCLDLTLTEGRNAGNVWSCLVSLVSLVWLDRWSSSCMYVVKVNPQILRRCARHAYGFDETNWGNQQQPRTTLRIVLGNNIITTIAAPKFN